MSEKETWAKVAIIVLNWNGWRDTIECLESLQRLTYPNYQIIVVDNGSTDDSVEKIKAWARGEIPVESKFIDYDPSTKPVQWVEYDREKAEVSGISEEEEKIQWLPSNRRLIFIHTGENLGFAGGNNVALQYVLRNLYHFVHIWLLNNDTIVDKIALEMLVKEAKKRTSEIIGSKVFWYEHPEMIQTAGGGRVFPWLGITKALGEHGELGAEPQGELDYVSGTSLFTNVRVVKDVGFFDEHYFLYWEEVDWCQRAKKKGYRLGYQPYARVWHKIGSSLCHISPLADYYNAVGMSYFLKTHYKPQLIGALSIGVFGKIVNRLIRGQICNLGAILCGTLKGLICW